VHGLLVEADKVFFVARDTSRRVWRQGAFYASASPTQGFPLWGTDKTVFKEFRLVYNLAPYAHHKGQTAFVFIYREKKIILTSLNIGD
jgi:hypothetical protein